MHLKLPDPGGNRRRPRKLVQLLCAGDRSRGVGATTMGKHPIRPPSARNSVISKERAGSRGVHGAGPTGGGHGRQRPGIPGLQRGIRRG